MLSQYNNQCLELKITGILPPMMSLLGHENNGAEKSSRKPNCGCGEDHVAKRGKGGDAPFRRSAGDQSDIHKGFSFIYLNTLAPEKHATSRLILNNLK